MWKYLGPNVRLSLSLYDCLLFFKYFSYTNMPFKAENYINNLLVLSNLFLFIKSTM